MPTPEELAADAAADTPEAPPGLLVLVNKLIELKTRLDAVEVMRKDVQQQYDNIRKVLLPQVFADHGWTSVRTSLGTLSLRHKNHAAVAKDRQQAARDWCRGNNCADLLTLEPATAQWLVNDLIERGEPVPDFIRVFTEETAVLTRKKE